MILNAILNDGPKIVIMSQIKYLHICMQSIEDIICKHQSFKIDKLLNLNLDCPGIKEFLIHGKSEFFAETIYVESENGLKIREIQ